MTTLTLGFFSLFHKRIFKLVEKGRLNHMAGTNNLRASEINGAPANLRTIAEQRLGEFCRLPSVSDYGAVRATLSGLEAELMNIRRLGSKVWKEFCDIFEHHEASIILRRDPITGRAAAKPRGYAGDAALLDYIYFGWNRKESEGDLISSAIHDYVFESPSCAAVRERRDLLAEHVDSAAQRTARPTIFAIAAGHLREADCSEAFRNGKIGKWLALDQDGESLAEINRKYGTSIETIESSVKALITGERPAPAADFAYAAGLYDYLPDTVAKKLTKRVCAALKPGGTFLFANFSAEVENAGYMECVMDWHLILRSMPDMERIAAVVGEGFSHRHWHGVSGSILYWEITRLPTSGN